MQALLGFGDYGEYDKARSAHLFKLVIEKELRRIVQQRQYSKHLPHAVDSANQASF